MVTMDTTTAIGYRANLPVTDPASLATEQVETPTLHPHDLLVEVKAVSVNPVDVKLRAGVKPSGLRVLGFDAAGVVTRVGEAVTLFSPGDEVYYAGAIDRPGTNQRLHAVDERIVGRKPSTLSFADAAGLPLVTITAWESLFDRLRFTESSDATLLVVGATGGVGSMMMQLAEALLPSVRVIATASSPERDGWVRSLGAEASVNHRLGLVDEVLRVAPNGVDAIFTAHSAGQIEAYANILTPFGAVVAIDDGPRDIEPLKGKSASWHWEFMFARSLHHTDDMIEQHNLLNAVADLVDAGQIRSLTTKTLSPINAETLRQAHQLVESNHTLGKVVVEGWQ